MTVELLLSLLLLLHVVANAVASMATRICKTTLLQQPTIAEIFVLIDSDKQEKKGLWANIGMIAISLAVDVVVTVAGVIPNAVAVVKYSVLCCCCGCCGCCCWCC